MVPRCRRRNEGGVRRGGDLRHFGEQGDVVRAVVEFVITDDATEGLAAELAEFLLVDLLEDRALVPGAALVVTQGATQFLLADVHHPDAQVGADLGIRDQIMQAAPGAFHFLHFGVMQDLGQLLGNLGVNLGDQFIDRFQHVLVDHDLVATDELQQGVDRRLHRFGGLVGAGTEGFLQQLLEFAVVLQGDDLGGIGLAFEYGTHRVYSFVHSGCLS